MNNNSYFTLQEFIFSSTALRQNINNTPTQEVINHFYELLPLLNGLREMWGSPIIISSGYRCPELNKLVGGSKTSAHLIGYACDLVPVNGRMDDFIECCKRYFKDRLFDQVIIEKSGSSRWVHFGYKNLKGEQRRQLFSLNIK